MPASPSSSAPKESEDLETENPRPTSESEDPSQKQQQPLTVESQSPPGSDPVDPPNPGQEQQEGPQIVVDDPDQDDPEPEPEVEGITVPLSPIPNPPVSSVRRAPKRKKGSKSHKSQVAIDKILQALSQNFKPIPFVPGQVLDFSKHEELLKRLSLWEFVHIEFDRTLRVDLITELVARYAPKTRASYVKGYRIGVNRADLGRALKLPGKKSAGDCETEAFPPEFLFFLDELVSNWMLLHEDLWITPSEVLNWTKLIKNGQPEKVDWSGLIWFMVEKELAQGPDLKNCYYASHLQQLIKVQKEELFRENQKVELELDADDDDGGDVKMLDFDESSLGGHKLEEQDVELRLGQDVVETVENKGNVDGGENVCDSDKEEKLGDADKGEKVGDVDKVEDMEDVHHTEFVGEVQKVENAASAERVQNNDNNVNVEETKDVDMMDFGECKGQDQVQWLLDGKNDGGQPFLQHCNMADVKPSTEDKRPDGIGEEMAEQEVEEEGHVEGFKIIQKGPLDGLSSANLMQAFETVQLPYNSSELGGHSSLDVLSSRPEGNVMLGGPSMFNHAGKREIGHGHEISNHGLNDNQKRMRIDDPWDHKPPEVDMCIEQIMHWAGKARMAHETAKAEAYQQTNMTQQIFAHEITEKDNEILQLRCKLDELQRRRQAEISRLDKELYLMSSVIDGYRRALKETQRAFAEYRKCSPVPDKPIYKDAGGGGVVKSIMELERERIKQEEERKIMSCSLEETYKRHLAKYNVQWEEFSAVIQSLDGRLLNAAKEVELLKEHILKRKTSGSAQNRSDGHGV